MLESFILEKIKKMLNYKYIFNILKIREGI